MDKNHIHINRTVREKKAVDERLLAGVGVRACSSVHLLLLSQRREHLLNKVLLGCLTEAI